MLTLNFECLLLVFLERCSSLITHLVLSFIDLVAFLNCIKVDINCLSSQKADVEAMKT